MRRIVLSKPSTFRGWVCALCTVPVLAIAAIALLVLSPAQPQTAANGAAGRDSAASLTPQTGTATPAARRRIQESYGALPLAFEQNQGQTDDQVKYMARGNGYTLFLTAKDAVFSLRSPSAESKTATVRRGTELHAKNSPRQRNTRKDSIAVVRMQLVGGNSLAKVSASGQLPGKSNYFLGNDPGQWHTDVAHYARVSYQDVYPGVNLAFHGAERQLEFDFVVAPGANPAPIGFHFTGAQGMKRDDSGNLIISSAAGDVLLHKPVAYQEKSGARQPVEARFALKAHNQVSFELGNYDHSRELVIDPSVLYATYLGGSGNDEGYGIAFDSSNNAYVTGQTASSDFPTTTGAYRTALTGTANVFVTSIAASGSSLIYSTYLGGNGSSGDSGNAIAVDQTSGAAYVVGGTTSSDFPTTSGAFQTTLNGPGNAFVFELSPGVATALLRRPANSPLSGLFYAMFLPIGGMALLGLSFGSSGSRGKRLFGLLLLGLLLSSLLLMPACGGGSGSGGGGRTGGTGGTTAGSLTYSTYLGGTGTDVALGIALASDNSGDIYVAGKTSSSDFPTLNPLQTSGGGFVTKLNSSGTALVYSSYLAVAGDSVNAVAVDSSDNAYVTGQTYSSNFHTTAGAYQTTCGSCTGGNSNAFVTVLNPAGSAYVYSTFLGGSGIDAGNGIVVDTSDSAYVTGVTESSNFPTTSGAYQTNYGGSTDAFVTKMNPTGSALVYSTFLGGSAFDTGAGIAIDGNNNAYVTGQTSSTNFPTANPTQSTLGGGTDAFVTELNSIGSQLIFSTYLGGSGNEDDGGFGAIATNGGNIFVTGDTDSTNFPTQSPYQAANGGGADAFVVVYSQSASGSVTLSAPRHFRPPQ
jgi:Beta-propeller repeat